MKTKLILSMAFFSLLISCGRVHAKESKHQYKFSSLKSRVPAQESDSSEELSRSLLAQAVAELSSQTDPPTNGNVIQKDQVFEATCDFGSFGSLKITEGKDTLDLVTKRYLTIEGTINHLCPLTSYTLSFSIYDNILDKCKNVGPTLGGSLGIVNTDITTDSGDLIINVPNKGGLVVLPSNVDPNYVVGASCVIRMNQGSYGYIGSQAATTGSAGTIPIVNTNNGCNQNPFEDRFCRLSCPAVICASVVMKPAAPLVIPTPPA